LPERLSNGHITWINCPGRLDSAPCHRLLHHFIVHVSIIPQQDSRSQLGSIQNDATILCSSINKDQFKLSYHGSIRAIHPADD
jgi:hypothetical protein